MEKQGDENWWIQSKMEKHGVDGPAIGIHLGATFSCVAVRNNSGAVTTIQNDQGGYTTPCYVAFRDMETLVGEAAKNQAFRNPANTIFDAKRLIGRKWSDPCVQNDIKNWPFKVISSSADDKPVIVVREGAWEKRLAPEDISAAILRKMKQSAEAFLGCSIRRAVVTVPACFNDSQRRSTTIAGAMAGFRIVRVIDEPTAAARAYGLGRDGPKKVLVFDLGRRTLQVSIVQILDGRVEIIATGGDDRLGGEDFDSRLVTHIAGDFKKKHGQDVTRNAKAMRRLRSGCESAKRSLTDFSQLSIFIESLHDGIDLDARVSRAIFESLNADLLDKCMGVVRQCLDGAKMERDGIDDVVLVSGSTRIPKVKNMLAELFGEKTTIHDGISPKEVLAVGAAVAAAELGDEEQGDEIIISCSEMVADENLTPLSLGVRDVHGVMKVLVPRNTRIPVTKELRWTITEKNISSVSLPIYEGERAMARDNNLLGSLRLDGISSSTPAHSPSLKIMLRVDADGTLGISAEDMISAHKAEVTVRRARDRLTQGEIYAMIAEAETRLVTKCRLKGCLCTALAKSAASSPKFAMESGFLEVMLDCHGPNVGLHQPDQIENLRMRRWGPEGPVIGIDLGTTNSRVGVWTFYKVEIVANADGSRLTPSCVAFKGKQVLVGDAAKLQASTNRENTIFEAKRLMGRRWTDRCVQYDAKRWPFRVIPGADGKPLVAVRDGTKEKYLAAEEISAAILGNMKRSAEAVLRCPVSRAVLTVPACFDDSQRQSAVAAGAIAGLEIVRIVDEPTAAAVAYGLDSGQRKVLVFSLGGGSLDVSILEISNGKVGVVSAGGDGHLGGESINSRLVSYLAGDFRDKHGRDVTRNAVAMRRLRDASEAAKRGYAAAPLQEIAVEGLHDGIDYHTWLTRAKFERLNMGLFRRCIDIVQQCIGNAKVDKGSIDDIVLVGGSTRILKVQEMLREFFAGKTLHSSLSPEETVAIGAAVQAARTVFGRTDPLPAQGFLL